MSKFNWDSLNRRKRVERNGSIYYKFSSSKNGKKGTGSRSTKQPQDKNQENTESFWIQLKFETVDNREGKLLYVFSSLQDAHSEHLELLAEHLLSVGLSVFFSKFERHIEHDYSRHNESYLDNEHQFTIEKEFRARKNRKKQPKDSLLGKITHSA